MARRALRLLAGCALIGVLAAGAGALYLQDKGITPRALAPYIDKRTSGHNPTIEGVGQWSAAALVRLDRGESRPPVATFAAIGARAALPFAGAAAQRRIVSTSDEVRRAIAAAAPGDVITLLPGRYQFADAPLYVSRPGTAAAPIVLRAEQAGSVTLEFALVEGFIVSAPYWHFENLAIRGVCLEQAQCEHAFHVVGAAHHFEARNNTITDFNAHFKINGDQRLFPDHGLIDGNTLRNASARSTSSPVTLVDLVAASGWTIRRNLIADFIKSGGDRISYGGFVKGAGSDNVFEQNVVLCEDRLRGAPGQRVGLSLGGGGTGRQYCRDGRCITEQDRAIVRANLIASCSDDGIYLNNAAASELLHNTLVDTGGIQARFAGTSADVEGNLVDGDIRSRDGALLRLNDNLSTPIALLYTGYHAQRRLFADDFQWKQAPPRRAKVDELPPDLCGGTRPAAPSYGAFEDISACQK
ncbi:right-handed parallel beta-helix repeat-containing protein [Massilia sp. TSP1-1-2]|uniref:right-handed parallel beta-helix repeat-containing protein n=1 Tax=Massilia sp. TSP1-1-2 TaxID=2804649 RepID=UPI003CF22133